MNNWGGGGGGGGVQIRIELSEKCTITRRRGEASSSGRLSVLTQDC